MPTEPTLERDRTFRFGLFELSEQEGELRKSGVRIKLRCSIAKGGVVLDPRQALVTP